MGLIAAAHYLAPLIFIYGAIFKGSGDPLHQVTELLDRCHALSLDRMPGMHHIGHRNKKSPHRLRQQVQRCIAVCDLHQRQQQVRIQFVITAPPQLRHERPVFHPQDVGHRLWRDAVVCFLDHLPHQAGHTWIPGHDATFSARMA